MTFRNRNLFNLVNAPLKTLRSLTNDFKNLLFLCYIFCGRFCSVLFCLPRDRFDPELIFKAGSPVSVNLQPFILAFVHPSA